MSQSFDPYYHWLGIHPTQQPPNCYQLLGIQPFESNRNVIDNAADRQMTYIRSFQTGRRSEISQKLLNELASARIRLLDEGKKTAYDKGLRAKQQTPPAASSSKPGAVPMSAPSIVAKPITRPQPRAVTKEHPADPSVSDALSEEIVQAEIVDGPPATGIGDPSVTGRSDQFTPLAQRPQSSEQDAAEWSIDRLEKEFSRAMLDCANLYVSSARQCSESHSGRFAASPEEFLRMMDDLHKCLLIKIYVTVAGADGRWSRNEIRLARRLFQHIWHQDFQGQQLRDAAARIFQQADGYQWYALLRPFDQLYQLRDRVGELEAIVMRVANFVAKTDGVPQPIELASLKHIEDEITSHLRPIPLDAPGQHEAAHAVEAEAIQQIETEAQQLRQRCELTDHHDLVEQEKEGDALLTQTLAEGGELIGLEDVKREFHALAQQLQENRRRGVPHEAVYHMVFAGNQGTGKTTVARKLGRMFRAVGLLRRGHLVEADRSELVGDDPDQTKAKVTRIIDEALDGVLFIDEAHLLVSESRSDPAGKMAVDVLLRRMSTDGDRLIVILAGEAEPLSHLIDNEPVLRDVISRTWRFADFTPGQLGQMFGGMCRTSSFQTLAQTQAKLLLGFRWACDHREQVPANGRWVRDVFESAVVNLSKRIADAELTGDVLSVIHAADVEMPGVPQQAWKQLDSATLRFAVSCPGCDKASRIPTEFLSRRVKCNLCSHRFTAAWGEPCS